MQTVFSWFTDVLNIGWHDPYVNGEIAIDRVLPTLCCTLVVCVAVASLFKFLLSLVR